MKNLKKAIIPIVILIMCIFAVTSVSAAAPDSFVEGHKYIYNNTEYIAKRPDVPVTTYTYYVGGSNGNDSVGEGNSKETPFATMYGAITYAQNQGYLNDVAIAASELVEVKLVLVGNTNETKVLPMIKGGILTVTVEDGIDVTVNIGTQAALANGNFFYLRPNGKNSNKYVELNLGEFGMNGTITFDCTGHNPNNADWGGFVRVGDESYSDMIICNMHNGITIKNMGYDEASKATVAKRTGNVILVDCGTLNMYGGTITQNYCSGAAINVYNRNGSGAGAYIYGGEIKDNVALAMATKQNVKAKVVVYDCLIKNNVGTGFGAIDCSQGGSTMIFYGGTLINNYGNGKKKQICANGNVYISDKVVIENGTFTSLDGSDYTVEGTFELNNHFDMVSRVFYAKDGSALAYGYCGSKSLKFKNGETVAAFENVNIDVNDYLYTVKNTTSCKYFIDGVYGKEMEISETMTSGVYYFGEEKTHNYILTEHKDATTTEAGYDRYKCDDCGHSYDVSIPVSDCEHEYTVTVVEATCTEDGYTLYECSKCGYSYEINRVQKLEHDYIIEDVKATCLAAGYKDTTCSRCDYHEHIVYEQLSHNFVLEKTYPTNIYRCKNGCNETKEKVFITYYQHMGSWSSEAAIDGSDTGSHVRYTVEVSLGQKIVVGQKLDGTDIAHQSSVDGGRQFFGWYTQLGEIFEGGEEITIDRNMVFYEAYGYEANTQEEFMNYFCKGNYVKLNCDIYTTSQIGLYNGSRVRSQLDLNGHNIVVDRSADGGNAFGGDRSGMMIIGKGKITHLTKNPNNYSFFSSAMHGYGDSDQNSLVHTLWIGKDVTVETPSKLYYCNIKGNALVPSLKIAGNITAQYIAGCSDAVTVDIFPTANITLTGSSCMNSFNNKSKVNIYGGTINFPDDMSETYFVKATYQVSGGTFNIAIPEDFIYTGCHIYNNTDISPKYYVIPVCTNGEHVFVVNSTTATCTEAGYTYYGCSCGAVIGADAEALGHNFVTDTTDAATCLTAEVQHQKCSRCDATQDVTVGEALGHDFDNGTVVGIAYANGFDKDGVRTTKCSRCDETDDTSANPIFKAKGYSVKEDGTAIMGGFTVNTEARDEYNTYAETPIVYGAIFANVNDGSDITFDADNKITNEKAIQVEVIDQDYGAFNYTIKGFNLENATANVKFVITAYVIDNGEISFVQANKVGDSAFDYAGNVNDGKLGFTTLTDIYASSEYANKEEVVA